MIVKSLWTFIFSVYYHRLLLGNKKKKKKKSPSKKSLFLTFFKDKKCFAIMSNFRIELVSFCVLTKYLKNDDRRKMKLSIRELSSFGPSWRPTYKILSIKTNRFPWKWFLINLIYLLLLMLIFNSYMKPFPTTTRLMALFWDRASLKWLISIQ